MVTATLKLESKARIDSIDLPVVDLSSKRDRVKKLMVKACEEFGFFKVINHGVPNEMIYNVEKESREFFSLPSDEKLKAGPPNPLGYGSKKIGCNGDTGDLEYLLLQADQTSIHERVRNINSKDTIKFSSVLGNYVNFMRALACDLLELLAEGLGLEDNKAYSKLLKDSENDSLIRLNHYPSYDSNAEQRLRTMNNKDDKISRIGFGEHTDPQILTILRSNNVEGLQIQSALDGNVWIPVQSDASAFFINVGDALQAMTNGRFVSVRHRAIVMGQEPRLSTMFFAAPSLQAWISPQPEMVTQENPLRYRPYTWAEYKKKMYLHRLAFNRLELFKTDCEESMIG